MPPPAPRADLTPGAAAALWKQLDIREPFLASMEARQEPQSLCRFFGKQDYEKLRGNPGLGYFAAGGFRWVGTRIAWQGLRPVTPDAAVVPEQTWDGVFRGIAHRHGWRVDPRASIRVKGACVGCVAEPSAREPERGVCIELQVTSPTGTLLYRFSLARPTLAEALGASLDWVLCCAAGMDGSVPQPWKGAQHGPAQP